jgi:hypothetical protein
MDADGGLTGRAWFVLRLCRMIDVLFKTRLIQNGHMTENGFQVLFLGRARRNNASLSIPIECSALLRINCTRFRRSQLSTHTPHPTQQTCGFCKIIGTDPDRHLKMAPLKEKRKREVERHDPSEGL